VYEALNQYWSPTDLSYFQSYFGFPVQGISANIGGHNSSAACKSNYNNCIEANLDVEYLMTTASNVPTTYFYDDSSDFLLTWAADLLDMDSPPLVHSISYSADESDLDVAYRAEFDTSALMLVAMGVTILAASGDDGVGGSEVAYTHGLQYCKYNPQFPAASPYVIGVGATQGPEYGETEIACSSKTAGIITSGGGFSSLYSRPSWQDAAVTGFFNEASSLSKSPSSGYTSGAGYPDLSSLGNNYYVYIGGTWLSVCGTV
jgi:tripeptidyl-peptidase-1